MTEHHHPRLLRIAVVGCGYWGSKHVRVLSSLDNIEVSIVDRDPAVRDALERAYPISSSAAELTELVDELDAVVIATPPTSHHLLARQALDAGLHVLVEKPLTTTVAHAQDLITIAAERDLRLMAGHTFQFNPAVWKLAEEIHDPGFGRVRYINSARLNLGLYQPDVDVLWDLAPHDISILNHLLDDRPTRVSAWGLKLVADRVDVAYLSLRYDRSDVSANIHVSWLDPMKVRRTTVVGEHRMAVYDDVSTEERLRIFDKGVTHPGEDGNRSGHPLSYRHGDIVSPFVNFREPLTIELEEFATSIRSGSTPAASGQQGLEVVSVLVAAEQSVMSGSWVDVDYGPVVDLRTSTNGASRLAEAAR